MYRFKHIGGIPIDGDGYRVDVEEEVLDTDYEFEPIMVKVTTYIYSDQFSRYQIYFDNSLHAEGELVGGLSEPLYLIPGKEYEIVLYN